MKHNFIKRIFCRNTQKKLIKSGKLLPCPWCGKRVADVGTIASHEYMDEDTPGYYWSSTHFDVVCDFNSGGCGGHTGPYNSAAEAVAAWNSRK